MNREIRNRRIGNEQSTRKIEIYRKNTTESGFQPESVIKTSEEPKVVNKENKIFFLKIGLLACLVVLIFITFLSSSLFSNPFSNTPKNTPKNEEVGGSLKMIPTDQPPQSDTKETLFFDKDGKPKLINIIIAGVGGFLVLKSLID